MMRLVAAIFAPLLMTACAGPNTSLSTLQFSADALPFPDNYQAEAARVVADRGGDPAVVRVSQPQQTIGAGVASPNRWYVCLAGMPAPAPSSRIPTAVSLAEQLLFQQRPEDRFYVVLVFSREGSRPTVKTGFDSPLCRDAVFESITVQPPVT